MQACAHVGACAASFHGACVCVCVCDPKVRVRVCLCLASPRLHMGGCPGRTRVARLEPACKRARALAWVCVHVRCVCRRVHSRVSVWACAQVGVYVCVLVCVSMCACPCVGAQARMCMWALACKCEHAPAHVPWRHHQSKCVSLGSTLKPRQPWGIFLGACAYLCFQRCVPLSAPCSRFPDPVEPCLAIPAPSSRLKEKQIPSRP